MPLTDRDPNVSGRTSRASNMSTGSRGLPKRHHGQPGTNDFLSSAPGVMSMLRTSTELGDVASLTSYGSSHVANIPREPPRRTGASSRMSTCSSVSNASRRGSSTHHAWPSASSGPSRPTTRDNNVPHYVPDTLSPTIINLPGSSPLFPRSRSRDGHRSLSMTNTSQPTFRLSSTRSFASLRAHEKIQRPRSPYRYPTRLRRPGYRPASPALSDNTGTYLRRSNGKPGHPGYGPSGHGGHPRLRHPSDVSVHRDDRGRLMPGYPSRNRSPTFVNGQYQDIPPVPPLHHHIVVEQARMLHRPAKGSVSSGSTNQRTDSDAPSTDAPSPPTPQGGRSMEALINPTRTQLLMDSMAGVTKEELSTGPLYYDHSEQFEREQFIEPGVDPVPTGFVHRIKTILEERGTSEPTPKKVEVSVVREAVEFPDPEKMGIAELPASPVPRRITRDMILAALGPASFTSDIGRSGLSAEDRVLDESSHKETDEHIGTSEAKIEPVNSTLHPEEIKRNRHSILSQAGSSIMDSSTLEFAVRYSIPMVTGDGSGFRVATRPASMTEDGMSDLLDGYQHTTDTTEEYEALVEPETPKEDPVERKSSNHTPKSSDEQSFKSCTDLPEQPDQDSDAKSVNMCEEVDAKSIDTCEGLPESRIKDSDARSFKTCKDVVTPECAVSVPPSRLPSSSLVNLEMSARRPVSEMPVSSPPATIRKQPPIAPRESSFTKAHARLRANSKLSSKHGGSTVVSVSSSIESLGQKAPVVPPRESSSSKEAQRTQAVADFLVRLSRTRRFSKAHSTFGRRQPKEEGSTKADETGKASNLDSAHALQMVAGIGTPSNQALELVKTPEKALAKNEVVPEMHISVSVPSKESVSMTGSSPVLKMDTPPAPPMHQYSMSTPSPVIPELSSIYSPEDIPSSSSRARVHSSPMAFAKSPEHGRHDSQTTTHLSWHGRKTSNVPPGSSAEPRPSQGNGQDETTTDLRLSAYRYPLHYLPDLKEESHEDSSLNTSASNLKNSSFKFPFGEQPSVRMSRDDAFLFGRNPSRNPSTRSYQQSSLAQTRGLPSMNFSRMDLIGKLNEALDIRCLQSLDGAPDNLLELAGSGPVRPASAGEIREKYRSFFASLDVLEKAGDGTQPGTIMDLIPNKRTYSPDPLMAEIDKLSIPSVGGLTQRLSEFLPSLKEYYKLGEVGEFVAEEVIMEHALEEIHEVGGPAQKRSSARLRPMPGSPNMVVIDDALYDELTGKEKEHASRGSSGEITTPSDHAGEKGSGRSRASPPARDQTPLAELEAPSPAILRTRSLSLGHQDLRPSLESRLSTRRSLRSIVVSTPTATTTDTRPWNSDKNYPWATNIPAIDISLPSSAATRTSPRPGPSRLRERLSKSSDTSTSSPQQKLASPVAEMSKYLSQSNADDLPYGRHKSRSRNPFKSKQSNNPQPEGFDASGNATRPLRLRESDQSHDVGERYPFSALTPPTSLHLPAIMSTNSCSSSESEEDDFGRPRTTRKGIFRRFALSARTQPEHAQGHDGNQSSVTNSMQDGPGEARDFEVHRQTFSSAEGMKNITYHRQKLVNRIKSLWHDSCVLVRNLSKNHRMSRSKSQLAARSPFPDNVEDRAIRDVNGRRIVPLEGTRGVALYTGV